MTRRDLVHTLIGGAVLGTLPLPTKRGPTYTSPISLRHVRTNWVDLSMESNNDPWSWVSPDIKRQCLLKGYANPLGHIRGYMNGVDISLQSDAAYEETGFVSLIAKSSKTGNFISHRLPPEHLDSVETAQAEGRWLLWSLRSPVVHEFLNNQVVRIEVV